MRAITFFFGICLLLVGACSAPLDIGPGDSGVPVFYLEGTVDQAPFLVSAGVDSVYLFTKMERNDFGLFELSGRFANESCLENTGTGCEAEWGIVLRSPIPEAVLRTGNVAMVNYSGLGGDSVYQIQVTPLDTERQTITLRIADLSGSLSPFPLQANVADSVATVELGMVDQVTGLKGFVQHRIFPKTPNACPLVQLRAKIDQDSVQLQLLNTTPAASYNWFNGATDAALVDLFQEGANYSVLVQNASGCATQLILSGLKQSLAGQWLETPAFEWTSEGAVAWLSQRGVEIWHIDAEGQRWSSKFAAPDGGAYFAITESTPYLSNEQGKSTERMAVKFQCYLGRDGVLEKKLVQGAGVIAVGVQE